MKLNAVEKALMNNPARAALQRRYEAPLLRRMGGDVSGLRVLEIGCGRGVGTEIILRDFGAAHVTAFDLDPEMVKLAQKRLARHDGRVHLAVGDAAAIQAPDDSFDAVFDFAIIHHVPDWQRAVSEVRRVLRPGGRFFFEEVTKQALERWLYRTFLEHPTENRFTGAEFIAELERQGLRVGENFAYRYLGDFVLGVARKADPSPAKAGSG
jgi:ubiquinone/menaquinone biosynthesis C-methylase UbiE